MSETLQLLINITVGYLASSIYLSYYNYAASGNYLDTLYSIIIHTRQQHFATIHPVTI